jgi:hypothetical protein
MEHPFLFCPFTEACWASLGLIIPHIDDIFAILDHVKTMLHLPFFMEIIVTVARSIWEVRNDEYCTFDAKLQEDLLGLFFKQEQATILLFLND